MCPVSGKKALNFAPKDGFQTAEHVVSVRYKEAKENSVMITKEQIFSGAYWLMLSALIFALTIFSIMVLFQGRNINYAIISTTPIIVTTCIILWVGDVTRNVSIPSNVSKIIFGSFVVVILSNAAMLIADNLKPRPIKFDYCVVLNEANIGYDENRIPYLTDIQERPNKEFTLTDKGDLIIAFGCKVKNFTIEENQEIDLTAEVLLINKSKEIAAFNILKEKKKIDSWERGSLVNHLGVAKVSKFFNVARNELIYLTIADKINTSVTQDKSTLTLSFRVFDRKAEKYAIFDYEIHLTD